jgi:hypothetical protein
MEGRARPVPLHLAGAFCRSIPPGAGRGLIFSRRRREIAAIEGRAVCPAATFMGGHLG